MTRTLRVWTTAAFVVCLAYQPVAAQERAPGVGPNGENGGFTAKFADVNGISTRYYDEGSGEPLVLVHGCEIEDDIMVHRSANTWAPVIGLLAERVHVYAPDRLAQGLTGNPRPGEPNNMRAQVQFIVDFIETLELGKVHLVGQSTGGGIAFLLAVNHPELVKTLVIIDSATAAPGAGDDRANRRRNLDEHCPREPLALWACHRKALQYDRDSITPDEIAAAAFMVRKRMSEGLDLINTDRRDLLEMNYDAYRRILVEGALQMPVLLYWGKNDPSVLPIQGEQLFNIIAETNPHARLLFINRAGHFHYREHPEEFAHTVTSFIDYWNGPGAKELTTASQ